jgi:hypothetical protein
MELLERGLVCQRLCWYKQGPREEPGSLKDLTVFLL